MGEKWPRSGRSGGRNNAVPFRAHPVTGKARSQLRVLARDPVLLVLLAAIALSIAVFVVYPLVRVLLASFQGDDGGWTLAGYGELAGRKLYRNALFNSLSVGVVVGVLSVVLGYLAAFVPCGIRRSDQRRNPARRSSGALDGCGCIGTQC